MNILDTEITKLNNECFILFKKLKHYKLTNNREQHTKTANKLIDKRTALYHMLKENLRLKASA